MVVANGKDVKALSFGGELFVKKLLGSTITVKSQQTLSSSPTLDNTYSGSSETITKDIPGKVIGFYYPSTYPDTNATVEVEITNSVGRTETGWVSYDLTQIWGG